MQPVISPRALTATAALIVVIWGVTEAKPFLVPVCIAALLAFLMAPGVNLMRKIGIPEWLAIAVCSLVLLFPFFGFGWVLVSQGQAFLQDVPSIIAWCKRALTNLSNTALGQRLHAAQYLNTSALIERLSSSIDSTLQFAISGLGAVLTASSQTALVLLFSVLMLASRRQLRSSAERLASKVLRQDGLGVTLLDQTSWLIEKFLIARLLIVLIIAAADTSIVTAFGLKYAVLMGAFLGIMTLLPAIGFIIAVIPPILVSLSMGFSIVRTIALAAVLLTMSAIEGNVLTPTMVGRSLDINALSTFIGLLAGGLLWGIWGMLLAIPFLGILRIIFAAIPDLEPLGDLLATAPTLQTNTGEGEKKKKGEAA